MHKRNILTLAVLAAIGSVVLPASGALAEDEVKTTARLAEEGGTIGQIGIGAGYLSEDTFRLGRFTGITEEGFFPDLSFEILSRSSYLDEKPSFWRLEGRNLGLDSQSLLLNGGSQGRYSVFLYYRELPNLIYPNVGTPYQGVGSRNLTLPPDGGFGTLEQNLHEIDIETERQRVGLGGRVNLTRRWRASMAVHHEHKEGTKVRGIGEHWGLQRSTIVPEPVDYDTTRFEADLTYDGERFQTRLGYMLSVFSQNGSEALNFVDAHALDWSAAPFRQDSLDPDNQFHQISANLGWSLGETTRLGADVQVGRMSQDSDFIASDAVVMDRAGNIRTSLDGEIDTTVVNLRASTRPFERLTLRANYRYDERDNKTPELIVDAGPLVNYTIGFQCGVAAGLSASQCATRPISYEQRRAFGEAEIRLLDRTFLSLNYTNDERERTYEDRKTTEEEIYEARLRSRWSKGMVMLYYSLAEQRGSNFERETLPEALRKYYLADRDRTRAGVHVSYAPSATLQAGLRVDWVDDDYIASELGLTASERVIYSWDVSWFPTDRLQTYAFYSYESRQSEQAGLGDGIPWTGERDDETFMVGIGGEYVVTPGVLKLGAEALYVETCGAMNVIPATVASQPYPDLESKLKMFSLYGDWTLSKRMALRLRYMLERYEEKDWGTDNVGVTGVGDLILLDRDSPDYTAHLVAVTLRYRF